MSVRSQSKCLLAAGRTDAEVSILGPPDVRADSMEKTLMLGKIEIRERGRQRMRWLDGIINSKDRRLSEHQETVRTGKPAVL